MEFLLIGWDCKNLYFAVFFISRYKSSRVQSRKPFVKTAWFGELCGNPETSDVTDMCDRMQ
jgi:hypothetical protein